MSLEWNESDKGNVKRDVVSRRETLLRVWLKTPFSLNIYEISLLSPSRMSQLKHAATLKGDVLQDMATGQLFKLNPTDEERQRGVW